MVYFRGNRKDKIRWHSWPNSKLAMKVESDYFNIFSRARSTLHKVVREFHPHFKFLQPLEFDFWAKFPNRPMRNHFFLDPTVFRAKSEKYKSSKSLENGYENFD